MKPIFRNIITLLVLTMTNAQAATYYVATTGNDSHPGTQAQPFRTIQKGIDAATHGDTVLVADGTYMGQGNRILTFNGKNITLQSQGGASATIIDCQGSAANPARGVQFAHGETNLAVLDGFTIKNGYSTQILGSSVGGGIGIQNSSPTIRNCILTHNVATNNNGDAAGGGLFILNGSPHIRNCSIANNTVIAANGSARGGGVAMDGGGSPTFINCTLAGNTITVTGSDSACVGGGLYVETATPTFTRCTIYGNTILDTDHPCAGGGVYVLSNANFTACDIPANQIAGRPSNVLGGGVVVESGSAVFTRCRLTYNSVDDYSDTGRGGGVYVNSTATFTHCDISHNRLTTTTPFAEFALGGGVFSQGTLTLADCTLQENQVGALDETYGGGAMLADGSATIKNCRFFGNIANSVASRSRGGGAAFTDGTATITNTLFVANKALCQTTNGFAGGGGVWSEGVRVQNTFTNCTFTQNRVEAPRSPAPAGGMGCAVGAHTSVTNCIFYGNTAPVDPELEGLNGYMTVSYSNVQGGSFSATNGGHNINANPLFVRAPFTNGDGDYGDLHLQNGSPCINAGSATAPDLPPYDMDGYARNQGGAPDMGADEIGTIPPFDFYVDKAAGNDTTGNGTSGAPFKTLNKALSLISDPLGRAVVRIKAGSYGTDRPRVTQKVKFLNWGSTGQARIGKP